MIIIGEKLNSSIPSALELMKNGSDDDIAALVRLQSGYGADYIDINTALCDDELAQMKRISALAASVCDCGIVIDTPDVRVASACLESLSGRELIINSVTLDGKYDEMKKLAVFNSAALIALPISGGAIPVEPAERVKNALRLRDSLCSLGLAEDKLYIDILAEAVATDEEAGRAALRTLEGIKAQMPKVKCVCGLSNVSFGLPSRALLNSTFLAMLISRGLDAAICDPTNERIRSVIAASAALLGEDEYCMEYITKKREGTIA